MREDSQIKMLGFEILNKHLGPVDAEKFVALIQREKFNYTEWRENLFEQGEWLAKLGVRKRY